MHPIKCIQSLVRRSNYVQFMHHNVATNQTDDVNQSTKRNILLNSGTNGLRFNRKSSRNRPTYVRYCKFQSVTPYHEITNCEFNLTSSTGIDYSFILSLLYSHLDFVFSQEFHSKNSKSLLQKLCAVKSIFICLNLLKMLQNINRNPNEIRYSFYFVQFIQVFSSGILIKLRRVSLFDYFFCLN